MVTGNAWMAVSGLAVSPLTVAKEVHKKSGRIERI
jgi:hypothetical protein